jgi:ABC-type branched-subunit amino acid transport system permease subunit
MRRTTMWTWAGLAMLALFPFAASLLGLDFYISFVRRVLIFALAAAGLNLVLGYGGMVALGHAAFFGAGAYAVAILATAGVHSALVAWPVAAGLAALLACITGAVSLRTRGVYFIMITLAFAQMLFYVFISLRQYGGEDGLNLPGPATLPGVDVGADVPFYYVVLLLFAVLTLAMNRLVDSRFGAALQGVRENESRMAALGYPVYRIKLTAFVIGAAVAGLAGALLANNNLFVSPSLLHWTQSANLLIMVLVGGMGVRYGGLAGAAFMLVLEEVLRMWTEYWHLPMGLVLLAVVFAAPRGLAGLAGSRFGGRDGHAAAGMPGRVSRTARDAATEVAGRHEGGRP